MRFNDLLERENIDTASVLVLRHTPSERDGGLKEVLPWLAAVRPDVFNAYQQTQSVKVEAEMLRAKYVASFIGLEKRKGDVEHAAVFIGLYKVGEHKPLTYKQFWEVPAYQELKQHGIRGYVEGQRPSVLWFDLTITDFYRKWEGKLIIDWPRPPIKWSRFANKAEFPISAILEDSVLHKAMPAWSELVVSKAQFGVLPPKWCEELSRWRGIYYIFYPSDGKGYVGSAAGEDNIYGRWKYHMKVGGDSVQMRKRKLESFEFSILQILPHDLDAQDVTEYESRWKRRLHTYSPSGLNDN